MKKYSIYMRSKADTVEGHGVLSAYREQVELVRKGLADRFCVKESFGFGDITHYHTVNPGYFLTLPLAKLRGTTVGYVHFLPETIEKSLRLSPLVKKVFYKYLIAFYKSMDYLVTVNPVFIDKLQDYGIPAEKIRYIPNYVSDREFFPLEKEKIRLLRTAYNLDPDKFTVMCAGQLQTRKGVLEFADLARKMPQMQFIWAGGFSFGQMTDGFEEISVLLANPPENLKFPGMVPREKMNELYNIGDVMFLPSYGELFPMTILEAMSCQKPVLLRDLDIYPRILFDFYLKGDGQQDFENILSRLACDAAFYEKAQKNARCGHLFYNAEHVLSMWDAFYSQAATEKRQAKHSARVKSAKLDRSAS